MSLWRDFFQNNITPSTYIEVSENEAIADDSLLLTTWQKSAIETSLLDDKHRLTAEDVHFSATEEAKLIMRDYLAQLGMLTRAYPRFSWGDTLLMEASLEAISACGNSLEQKALKTLELADKASNHDLKMDCLKAVTQVIPPEKFKLREKFFAAILKHIRDITASDTLSEGGVVN